MEKEKTCAGERSLFSALALAARLIYVSCVYMQECGNALWIQAVIASLVTLPILMLLQRINFIKFKRRLQTAAAILCFPVFLFDFCAWLYALSESAAFTAFERLPVLLLYLPALLASYWMARQGEEANEGFGTMMIVFLIILFLGCVVWQIRQMHFIWITPVLGGGTKNLLRCGLKSAGAAVLFPVGELLFTGEDRSFDRQARRCAAKRFCIATLAAVLFLLNYGMLAPNAATSWGGRFSAMERLLTGGGRGTSVQFLLLLFWYGLLLCAGVWSLLVATRCLRIAAPKLKNHGSANIVCLLAAACAPLYFVLSGYRREMLVWNEGLMAGLAFLSFAFSGRRNKNAQ